MMSSARVPLPSHIGSKGWTPSTRSSGISTTAVVGRAFGFGFRSRVCKRNISCLGRMWNSDKLFGSKLLKITYCGNISCLGRMWNSDKLFGSKLLKITYCDKKWLWPNHIWIQVSGKATDAISCDPKTCATLAAYNRSEFGRSEAAFCWWCHREYISLQYVSCVLKTKSISTNIIEMCSWNQINHFEHNWNWKKKLRCARPLKFQCTGSVEVRGLCAAIQRGH